MLPEDLKLKFMETRKPEKEEEDSNESDIITDDGMHWQPSEDKLYD